MEKILMNIEWVPFLFSTIIVFVITWYTYWPVLYMKGLVAKLSGNMKYALGYHLVLSQVFSSLLFTGLVGLLPNENTVILGSLAIVTAIGSVGLYSVYRKKSRWTIGNQVIYLIALTFLVMGINFLYKLLT